MPVMWTWSVLAHAVNGNTRTNAGNVFAYDVENRLTNYNNGAATYVYDGDGNRVRKTAGGSTTLYLVDDRNPSGYAQVLEELTVSGGVTNLSRVYAYGLDLLSQRDAGSGTTYYFGYDGNGNTRYLTPPNASLANVFAYDAFGTLIASNAAPQTDYLFTGEQREPTLGLYYLRARYLNTGTGRFWTRDPVEGKREDVPSLHRYIYAQNNTVQFIDPGGTVVISPGLGIKVHNFLGREFLNRQPRNANRWSNRAIQTVLGQLGYPGPYSGRVNRRPDLAEVTGRLGEVYEIKPGTMADPIELIQEAIQIATGSQLPDYIATLQANTPAGAAVWSGGTSFANGIKAWPGFKDVPGETLVTVSVYQVAPGVILYTFVPSPEALAVASGVVLADALSRINIMARLSAAASAVRGQVQPAIIPFGGGLAVGF